MGAAGGEGGQGRAGPGKSGSKAARTPLMAMPSSTGTATRPPSGVTSTRSSACSGNRADPGGPRATCATTSRSPRRRRSQRDVPASPSMSARALAFQ